MQPTLEHRRSPALLGSVFIYFWLTNTNSYYVLFFDFYFVLSVTSGFTASKYVKKLDNGKVVPVTSVTQQF